MARPNYIGNLISWRRSNVVALGDRLEQVGGRPWLETLARAKTLSEYMLYGVFVDQVLGEAAGHVYDWSPLCHEYWRPQPLDDRQLAEFFAAARPEHIAVMISAKAGIAPDRYRHYLQGGSLHRPGIIPLWRLGAAKASGNPVPTLDRHRGNREKSSSTSAIAPHLSAAPNCLL